MTASHTLRGLGQLVAYIPYQLGFSPRDSVTLVPLGAGSVIAALRCDLHDAESSLDHLRGAFRQGRLRATDALIAVVHADPEVLTDDARVAQVARAVGRFGDALRCPVDHLVLVAPDGRWWAWECSCGDCPGEAAPPEDVSTHPAALAAVVRGADPGTTRRDLEVLTTPTAQEEARAMRIGERLATLPPPSRPAWRAIARVVSGPAPVDRTDDRELVRATAAMQSSWTRDTVLSWLAPDAFDPELLTRDGLRPLRTALRAVHADPDPDVALGRVVRWACSVPPEHATPLWAVVAAHEWARGGGALASIALDRALSADPQHPLSRLVERCLALGVSPREAVA